MKVVFPTNALISASLSSLQQPKCAKVEHQCSFCIFMSEKGAISPYSTCFEIHVFRKVSEIIPSRTLARCACYNSVCVFMTPQVAEGIVFSGYLSFHPSIYSSICPPCKSHKCDNSRMHKVNPKFLSPIKNSVYNGSF